MTKGFTTRLLLSFIAICVAVLSVSAGVLAEDDIPQDKLNAIQQRCGSSQFILQQIEKRDAVSRINRGRAYDQMLRQISALNSRFAYNKISSPDLIQLTSQLQAAVDKFRANYDRYDSDLTDAMRVDCKAKPIEYYNMINQARNDRSSVGDEVKAIGGLMTEYREAVLKYKDTPQ